MNKKPVSILQEMMVKIGTVPSYELIHNGGGTHQNIFTFRVTCNGLTAIGTGRCKKDAKHEAATAMLQKIAECNALPQLPATPCESPTPVPTVTPVSPKSPVNVPFRNTIGELQDICMTNNLENPVYKETGDVGPPHARVFTVQCLVSNFVEEGISTTKKQAKHEAARKMMERIMTVVSVDQISKISESDKKKKEHIASQIAIAKYPQLNMMPNDSNKSKTNWGLKVENYHKKFKESLDEEVRSNLLAKLEDALISIKNCLAKKEFDDEMLSSLKQNFKDILESLDIQFHYDSLKTTEESSFFIGIQVYTAPDIYEIGTGCSEKLAELYAVQNVVQTMKFLLN